jgi:probable poly-beta-1,6-N-acetyl-D-glucosamine export protein
MTRRLLLLNGLAVIAAVLNHTVGWGFTSLFWWTDRYDPVTVPDFSRLGSASYYGLRLVEQIVTVGVPAFLFVSGFFVAFAAGRSGSMPWSRVGGRLRMLVIPYVLWSLAIFAGRALEGQADTAQGYVSQLLFGRAADPYYYVPLIAQLYLLAPVLVLVMRTHWRLVLGGLALVQLGIQAARYPVILGWDAAWAAWVWQHTPSWFFPHMAFWFALGIYAGLHGPAFRSWLASVRGALPWLTVGLALACVVEWELLLGASGRSWIGPTPTALDSLYCGALLLTFLAFADIRIAGSRYLDALGERSFGIYLLHAPVLELASRASYHVVPLLLAHQLLFQSMLVAAGLVVPLVAMALVTRSRVRPCYTYLFG